MARRKIEVIIAGDSSSLQRALGGATSSLSAFDKATGAFGGNLASGVLAATPAVLALSGSLVGLASSAAAAVGGAGAVGIGGIGALGVGLGSIALVAKPAADSFKKVGKALDAYNLVLDQHAKGSKQAEAAQKRLNAIVKENGGPVVLKTVKAWESLSEAFKDATGPARQQMFKAMNNGLGTMKALLPTVAGIANQSMAALGKALDGPLKMLRGNEFGQILRSLGRTFKDSIGPAVDAASKVLLGFGRIARESGTFVVEFAKGLDGLAGKFANATKDPEHLRAVIRGLVDQAKAWVHLGGAMGRVLVDLFHGSATSGKNLVEALTGALNKLDAKLRSVAGQKSLHDFFHQSAVLTKEFATALVPVLHVLTTLSVGVLPTYIAVAAQLKGVMGPLTYAFVAYKVAATLALGVTKAYTTAVTVGKAAVTAYRAAMIGLTAIRFGWAGLTAQAASGGAAVGKVFATKMSAVVAAGVLGWEIGSWISKHVPAVRNAANAIAKVVDHFLDPGIAEAERFDAKMAAVTANVQHLANEFKNATSPVAKNTAAIRLHIVADKAAEAAMNRTIATLVTQGATMDGTGKKSAALRAMMAQLSAKEQDAASQAAALKNQLDALPASKTINIQINTHQSGGGGAFSQNLPAGARRPKAKQGSFKGHISSLPPVFGLESELSGQQSLRDSTQAGFDAADQAARRSKDTHDARLKGKKNAATVRSAIQDLRALAVEEGRAKKLSAIDLKITGIQKAIDFKNTIAGIRTQLHDVASTAADAFRDQRTKDITDNSKEATELKQLQATDKANAALQEQASLEHNLALAQAGYTREQAAADEDAVKKQRDDAAQLLTDSQASNDLKGIEKAKALQKDADAQEAAIKQGGQAVIDAQNAIDAFKNQSREQELQDTIDANVKALDGPQGEVTLYKQGLDDKLAALVDNLNGKGGQKDAYAQFVADVNTILDGLNLPTGTLTFTASSTDEEAVTGDTSTGTKPRTKPVTNNRPKGKGKKGKHRASGGPVRRGERYIVGEHGEEEFVPSQNGTIIPHGKRHRIGRGGSYIHYGDIKLGGGTDVDRFLNRVAMKLA